MNFKETVQAMTGKEIVQAMIDGLNKPWVTVNMGTYGASTNTEGLLGLFGKKVCFGCAATNTICEINHKKFPADQIGNRVNRSKFLKVDYEWLSAFEFTIDCLREGNIRSYNWKAESLGIASLKVPEERLPFLMTDNYKERLHYYQEYCDTL